MAALCSILQGGPN